MAMACVVFEASSFWRHFSRRALTVSSLTPRITPASQRLLPRAIQVSVSISCAVSLLFSSSGFLGFLPDNLFLHVRRRQVHFGAFAVRNGKGRFGIRGLFVKNNGQDDRIEPIFL